MANILSILLGPGNTEMMRYSTVWAPKGYPIYPLVKVGGKEEEGFSGAIPGLDLKWRRHQEGVGAQGCVLLEQHTK